jgi:hypothetical protein
VTTEELADPESGMDHDPSGGAVALAPSAGADPDATRLAIASAGLSIIGFIALFRLTSGLDRTRASALRRFLAVILESLTGVGLGCAALGRLRGARGPGTPLAAVGVALGALNVVRVLRWLRLTRPPA